MEEEEEGLSLSSWQRSGIPAAEWAKVAHPGTAEEEGGCTGILKSVQNKPQASSEFLSIASLDPTPPGKGKGRRGQQLGREAPAQAAVGGHRAQSLGSHGSDSLRPPDRLLPSGCCGPASTGQDFLLSDGSVPLTGCICPPAVALVLPPQPRQEKHYFLPAS